MPTSFAVRHGVVSPVALPSVGTRKEQAYATTIATSSLLRGLWVDEGRTWRLNGRLERSAISRALDDCLVSIPPHGRPGGSFRPRRGQAAPPSVRPGTVAKADVIARLRSAGARLATIVAPAGYGKTTLLARWAEADPRRSRGSRSTGGDDDDHGCSCGTSRRHSSGRGRLARCSRSAVRPGAVDLVDERPACRGRPGRDSSTRSCWCSTICTPSPTVCLDVLAELFRYVPAGSQIAITSREEPALPLARWRAQGWVQEIGVADLRLDEQEAGLLLEAAGVELDATQLSELTERTEGWPAGLYLAALSMQAGAPQSATGRGLRGDDRFVSEYFRLELLSRLPPDEAQFLKYTSVLDRMCGGLCDAVLETTGSAETLDEARAHERLRRAPRPDGRVVPLPPSVRPAPPRRARAERAGASAGAQPARDGVVRRQRPGRGGDRLRPSCGRDGRRRRPDRRS